jgi:hypothetical protein
MLGQVHVINDLLQVIQEWLQEGASQQGMDASECKWVQVIQELVQVINYMVQVIQEWVQLGVSHPRPSASRR